MTTPEPPDSSAINKLLWLADKATEQERVHYTQINGQTMGELCPLPEKTPTEPGPDEEPTP